VLNLVHNCYNNTIVLYTQTGIICRAEALNFADMTVAGARSDAPPSCAAASGLSMLKGAPAFTLKKWFTGTLTIAPGGSKAAERVMSSTQLYWVARGQARALELAVDAGDPGDGVGGTDACAPEHFEPLRAQRYLLSAGDQFAVPAQNVYMLQNHSASESVLINWVILQVRSSLLALYVLVLDTMIVCYYLLWCTTV
jgi:hypothetical protein